MKHAGAESLDKLEGLLKRIRALTSLTERSRGVFYFRSKATLHFHEDPAGLFADLRARAGWQRYPVNTKAEQTAVLASLTEFVEGR